MTVTFSGQPATPARTRTRLRRYLDAHAWHPNSWHERIRRQQTGGLLVNQGTIAADGGGTLTVQGATNFAGGTLTGGTWEAVANSTLRVLGGDVTTNAASIVLDGSNSHFYSDTGTTNALASVAGNTAAGSLRIRDGANLTRAAFTIRAA